MQFQNLQVAVDEMPRVDAVELKPIEKDYLKVLYISWSIAYLILLAIVITLVLMVGDIDHGVWLPLSIAVVLLAAVATFVIGTGSFRRKAYAVREKDIIFRTGWIFQKNHIVPFNRVQHCLVQSGPIGRRYGLSSLSIYTAASNASDISIRGLKNEDAETLKAFILQHIQPLL